MKTLFALFFFFVFVQVGVALLPLVEDDLERFWPEAYESRADDGITRP